MRLNETSNNVDFILIFPAFLRSSLKETNLQTKHGFNIGLHFEKDNPDRHDAKLSYPYTMAGQLSIVI